MSNTINNSIPFVPENTIDPAAGLNIALNTIDALLQVLVQTVGANTPPAGVEGARHIVGTAPTGAWAGQANKLARFLDGVWRFYDARYVVNAADGALYVRSGSVWTLFSPPISDNSVTNAKLADMATQTIKGRTTAGTGDPEDLTAAQARAVLALGSAATRDALGTTGSLYSRDSILGTVSQSGGIPTGAIIERGSNANGEYVRFADGTAFFSSDLTTSLATAQQTQTEVSGHTLYSLMAGIVFPTQLISGETFRCGIYGDQSGLNLFSFQIYGITGALCNVAISSLQSFLQAPVVGARIVGYGRWY